jgi:23S rRNA (uracil1939-C5)-methyltransferase
MSDLIVRIAAKGEGVTADGRHAMLAAPGDQLTANGSVIAGPHHANPPCWHFPTCGGCQIQHVDDVAFGDFMIQRITGALHSQEITPPPFAAPILTPPATRRRATMKAEKINKKLLIGFNEARSHKLVDLAMCPVLHPALFAMVEPLGKLLRPLVRRTASIGLTLVDQGVDVAIDGAKVDGLAAIEAVNDFAAAHKLARLTIDDGNGPQPYWQPEPATVTFGGVAVPFPPGGFLQATAAGEAALLAAVRTIVGDAPTVIDLFAGLGTFALPLSAKAKIWAIEGARDAAMALKVAADRVQRPVAVAHRDLFRRPMEVAELNRFAAVVLDPPRAGAWEQMPALAASTVKRLAYVSCNPATFARDAKVLIDGGWTLAGITPVGQFRWSTHIELVAEFRRDL